MRLRTRRNHFLYGEKPRGRIPVINIRFRENRVVTMSFRGELGTSPFYATPSFFCRLDDDVVYWNTMRLSGKT